MATRKYSKKAKGRKQRTYRKKKSTASKRAGSTLTKRQKAFFFASLAGATDDSEE